MFYPYKKVWAFKGDLTCPLKVLAKVKGSVGGGGTKRSQSVNL